MNKNKFDWKKISPFVTITKSGGIESNLGAWFKSEAGQKQLENLRKCSELIEKNKGKLPFLD
jgi:hypothetical protein